MSDINSNMQRCKRRGVTNKFDIDFQAIISENRNVAYQYKSIKMSFGGGKNGKET